MVRNAVSHTFVKVSDSYGERMQDGAAPAATVDLCVHGWESAVACTADVLRASPTLAGRGNALLRYTPIN